MSWFIVHLAFNIGLANCRAPEVYGPMRVEYISGTVCYVTKPTPLRPLVIA